MIFESHAHYDDQQFDEDRHEILQKVLEAGVTKVVNAASNLDSSVKIIELCNNYEHVYGAVGVHPHDVADMHDLDLETILGLASHKKIIAIGEIGLDYYYDNVPKEIQKLWFREQIALAKEIELPIIIHSRDAAADTYDILAATNAAKVGGVIHCFSYSKEMAQRFIDLGFYIGIGGVVTFEKAKDIKEVVKAIPMEKLLIETDAPYLAPVPSRGKRNDSTKLSYIIQAIADIRGLTYEEIEEITYNNGMKLFFNI
ncbi:MAG: TatD family hydrolase [Vallitaleaceae bacterium]|jgi:TatD DNase family protein|nr:TatD family hydrolase [Vallitaleaceae bacterium]